MKYLVVFYEVLERAGPVYNPSTAVCCEMSHTVNGLRTGGGQIKLLTLKFRLKPVQS